MEGHKLSVSSQGYMCVATMTKMREKLECLRRSPAASF